LGSCRRAGARERVPAGFQAGRCAFGTLERAEGLREALDGGERLDTRTAHGLVCLCWLLPSTICMGGMSTTLDSRVVASWMLLAAPKLLFARSRTDDESTFRPGDAGERWR
jgi:hypothetical protein